MTRAIKFLKSQGIPFQIAEYGHQEKGAVFASGAIGMPLEQTVKTLVVEVAKKGYRVVLMPGSKTIVFKNLAKTHGAKRAAMVDADTAERLTGYKIGGISPFAMKQSLRVIIDKGLLEFDRVAINGGKRGIMLIMRPTDILRVTDAEPTEL